MSRYPEIILTPGLLEWARDDMNLSKEEVLKKAKVDENIYNQWVAGSLAISIPKLKEVANIFKRPLATFFLPAIPNIHSITPEFRTLDSVKNENLSTDVRLAVRQASRNREIYEEVNELLGNKNEVFKFKNFSLKEDKEKIAIEIREFLRFPIEEQKELKSKSTALKKWINVLENRGILVFQFTLPIEQLRGFCLKGGGLPPAIILNTQDDEHGRIFTLLHEFAHLLIKDSEIVQVSHSVLEAFANHIAGAVLVPQENLLTNDLTEKYLDTASESDYYLSRLSGNYRVSKDVILRRLFLHCYTYLLL
jgi:Zn-dependent peptidase ImmA (M78 family)